MSRPSDPLEVQADHVAEVVMSREAVRIAPTVPDGPAILRCPGGCPPEGCEDHHEVLRAVAGGTGAPGSRREVDVAVPRAGGRPLDGGTRAFFEGRFGRDFGDVRVHTDASAAGSAASIGALAYTSGSDVVFAPGRYAPETTDGRRLLAHELTHVVQQRTGRDTEVQRAVSGCDADKEKAIGAGVESARTLTKVALSALGREFMLTNEDKAFRANFGSVSSEQQRTIVARYENVRDTLGNKDIKCTKCSAKRKGEHLCAEGETPGSVINICPRFGDATCPGGPTILHESSHNAGATKDVKPGGRGYPPADSEDNAYSYEQFPVDAAKGPPEPKLERKPEAPIRPKSALSRPGDTAEIEADRIAETMTRVSSDPLTRSALPSPGPGAW